MNCFNYKSRSALGTTYDNSVSGLTAENVQNAIDEIASSGGSSITVNTYADLPSASDNSGKLAVVLHDSRNKKRRIGVQVAKIVYDSFHEKTPKFTRFDYIDGNTQNIALSNLRIKQPKKQDQYRKSNILFY